jgi:hypothetical protein
MGHDPGATDLLWMPQFIDLLGRLSGQPYSSHSCRYATATRSNQSPSSFPIVLCSLVSVGGHPHSAAGLLAREIGNHSINYWFSVPVYILRWQQLAN